MTDENKEVLASESPEEETNTADPVAETNSNDVDYEAELAKARAEKEKLEGKLRKAGEKIDDLKQSGTTIDEDTINRLVDEKIGQVTAQVKATAMESLIKQNASNEKEAELIKFYLENKIRPSGDDYADLMDAKALANKSKFQQTTSEMKRAALETEAQPQTTAGQKAETKTAPKLSAEEQKMARAFGLTAEELQKGYQRK